VEGKQDVRDGLWTAGYLFFTPSKQQERERGGEMGNLSWLPREDNKEVCEGR